MVLDPEWQDMLYELSEAHPGSILMAYAMERISEVRFRVSNFWCWVLGLGVWGLEFWNLGFGVWGLGNDW